jgi:arylsulfatase A-like enzyme
MNRLLLLLVLALRPPLGATPPNIVMIVADDVGYGDLGCYGSRRNPTPNLDALAAGGLRFTDYHSAGAMCSPTRASMLTGLYPQRFGADFDGALGENPKREVGLPLAAVTIAEVLKERGYATACIGKWHLGFKAPMIPTRQGFDVFRGLLGADGDHHTHIDRSGKEDWYANEKLAMEEGYTADLLTRHSIDFIRAHRNQPFFLYLPHLAIHFPWQGPNDPPHRRKGMNYSRDKWGIIPDPANVAPHVQAMLESLDSSVGRVMDTLRRLGLEQNTLVIFTSDNGGYINYAPGFQQISSNGIYRGQKTEIYEGGHRVPLIVSWPGRIRPGVSDNLTHSNDWMPTLLRLADPKVERTPCDGVTLLPHFLEGKTLPQRTLFWRARSGHAVRRGPWKLCVTGQKSELFHLGDDPGETTDRAGDEPALVQELSEAWTKWNVDVNRSAAALER